MHNRFVQCLGAFLPGVRPRIVAKTWPPSFLLLSGSSPEVMELRDYLRRRMKATPPAVQKKNKGLNVDFRYDVNSTYLAFYKLRTVP